MNFPIEILDELRNNNDISQEIYDKLVEKVELLKSKYNEYHRSYYNNNIDKQREYHKNYARNKKINNTIQNQKNNPKN